MEERLKIELQKEYPNDCETILNLVEKALETEKSCLLEDGDWSLSLDVEKEHNLQFYYYMNISKPVKGKDDIEISVSYENGINNGTMMLDYSMEGEGLCSPVKEIRTIVDITPDWKAYKKMLERTENPGFLRKKITTVIDNKKDFILGLCQKQSYDNYVTGGGTCVTDEHYASELNKLRDKNIFWLPVYDTIEVDRCFV
jgi:hypothetical protein